MSSATRRPGFRFAFFLSLVVLSLAVAATWGVLLVKARAELTGAPVETSVLCDGSKIAYVGFGDTGIVLINPDGSEPIDLSHNPSGGNNIDFDPDASADGSRIVFTSDRDGSDDIFIVNSDGTGLTNLTSNSSARELHAIFSPDGSKIAFYSTRDGNQEIYIMDDDGTNQTRLTNSPDIAERVGGFSPDGNKIVFDIVDIITPEENIFSIDIDGTNRVRLTEAGGRFPQYSPDGSLIGFISNRDGDHQNELFIMSADGLVEVRLTDEVGDFYGTFDFSPDGSKIVYGLRGPEGGLGDICSINSDGTNRTFLTKGGSYTFGASPKFSADGTKIAFVGGPGVRVMNADGSGLSGAISPPTEDPIDLEFFVPDTDRDGAPDRCDNCPANSNPDQINTDGDSLGDVCDPDDDNDDVADGSDNCPLVSNPNQIDTDGDEEGNACDVDDDNDDVLDVDDNCPLTPNREKILFGSNRGSTGIDIYTVNANGSGAQQNLTNSNGSDGAPSYSPGANKIAFESTRNGNFEIYTMNPDGSNVTRLTNNAATDANPDFSEDGTKIVFQSNRDGDLEIYIMNADGTGQTRLTNTPPAPNTTGLSFHPAFSPDGARIAFASDRDSTAGTGKNEEIYVMNADGTGVVRLTNSFEPDLSPDFSPNGSLIVFESRRDAGSSGEIYTVGATGGIPFRLTETRNNRSPVFSPDGSQIAFISSREGSADHIFVMTAVGTVETRLFQNSATEASPAYLPQLDSDHDGIGDACDGPNTPAGANVVVQTSDASVTFSNVSGMGETNFVPIAANSGDLPSGYTLCPSCPAYNITTTASYSPPVTVCLGVPANVNQQDFLLLKLMHGENGVFVDRTTGHITSTGGQRFVCGVVQSLSPFALASSAGPTAAPASISGTITDGGGAPVSGVVINLSGSTPRKTITDANGNYSFDNVEIGNFYTLTPSRLNYGFNPSSRSVSLLSNITDAAFTATPDTAIGGNVIDTPEYFVRQHYLDFLGREPDEAGFNFWSNQVLDCGVEVGCLEQKRVNVSAAYFLSIEFQETGGLVDGLYRASYTRRPLFAEFMPDSAAIAHDVIVGRTGWQQQLETNKQAFVDGWIHRSEFQAAYDDLSNANYVNELIAHTGVDYSAAEREVLVTGLTNGNLTRASVLRRIVEKPSFVRAKFSEAFVMMQYFGYLRRDPDESGYQFWLRKLREFNGNFEQAEMVKAFLLSAEYRARFSH